MYEFDRVTGEPIWPIAETDALASEVPGEEAWPTQPIRTKPAPYSRQGLVESALIDCTPAVKAAALKAAQRWDRMTSSGASRRWRARAHLLQVQPGRLGRREYRRRRLHRQAQAVRRHHGLRPEER